MKKTKLLQWLIVLWPVIFPTINSQAQNPDQEVDSVVHNIEYSYFFKHLEYLASDELKGRAVGSKGYAMAADYMASEFESNGLLPFGDARTYFQGIAFTKPSIVKSSIQFKIKRNSKSVKGIYGKNISIVVSPKYDRINVKQSLAFVGYGNILPEENINDYANVDVKGKMVIVALGGPKGIKNPALNDRFAKFDNAIAQGASGIILFYPNLNVFQNMIFKGVHGFLSKQILFLADTSISGSLLDLDLAIPVFAKKSFIKDIFKLNDLSLKKELSNIAKGNDASKELESVLKGSYEVTMENISCKNVVAMLPGTDPILKNEYVVLSSHLDHLGAGKAIKGDSIYNGMWDNASGSAALISMARAFSDLTEKLKRSIIFVGFTAEEKGLLGSHYYANRNNLSDGKIVANVNIDMLGKMFETTDVAPLGYAHSNLSEAVDYAVSHLNLEIDHNKEAESNYFERSDQISFIKNKIPALYIAGGYSTVDPKIAGEKHFLKWMKKRYHSPFDDLNQEYSAKAFLMAVKVNFLTAYYIANTLEEIKWNEDGWLYKKYVSK